MCVREGEKAVALRAKRLVSVSGSERERVYLPYLVQLIIHSTNSFTFNLINLRSLVFVLCFYLCVSVRYFCVQWVILRED